MLIDYLKIWVSAIATLVEGPKKTTEISSEKLNYRILLEGYGDQVFTSGNHVTYFMGYKGDVPYLSTGIFISTGSINIEESNLSPKQVLFEHTQESLNNLREIFGEVKINYSKYSTFKGKSAIESDIEGVHENRFYMKAISFIDSTRILTIFATDKNQSDLPNTYNRITKSFKWYCEVE